jgi:flagellar biosynthesis/type III secretory pathway chaperone
MAVQDLIETMERLVQLHDSLLELAEQKTKVLVNNEVAKLNQIVNKESQIVKQVAECDQRRVGASALVFMEKGYKPLRDITVSEVRKFTVKADDKLRLHNLQLSLADKIAKLRQQNDLNQQLIRQSLAFIEHSFDILVGPPEDDAVYTNQASAERGQA